MWKNGPTLWSEASGDNVARLAFLAWLQVHRLATYESVLSGNGIDLTTAPLLTDEDLVGLGFDLGARRRFLEAARELKVARAYPGQERRHLTVAFCDLVSWTERAHSLDAEEQRELLDIFRRYCAGVVDRFGGYVAQLLGDGLLLYFGWPNAHEDDAERAVRASLEIVEGISTLDLSPPLAVRVGIASGIVIVGAEGDDDNSLAIGEAPNLAARLMALAGPGEVVISSHTRDLLRGAFRLAALGEKALKGIANPVAIFRIVGQFPVRARFERHVGSAAIGPMFGRDAELNTLREGWSRASIGQGGAALISGVAGIGKSRLIHALKSEVAAAGGRLLQFDCSPHRSGTALFPIIELIRQEAGITEIDDGGVALGKLRDLVQVRGQSEASVGLIADLLSLPRGTIPAMPVSGQKHKEMTLNALVEFTTIRRRAAPLALIFEDIHWADPTTLELISSLLAVASTAGLYVVMTFRPEFVPPWSANDTTSSIVLSRLAPDAVAAIMRQVMGDRQLPQEVQSAVTERTDGIPLYAEELTKAALSGAHSGGQSFVPSTLQDSLLARLDLLGDAKIVIQIAACFGRDVELDVLGQLAAGRDVRSAMEMAAHTQLVFPLGDGEGERYSFSHILIRDAAYESLPLARRTVLHRRIADLLEANFPSRAAENPEILAHHLGLGDAHERAIQYWIKAGQRAISRFEMREARAYFGRGLDLLPELPAGVPRDTLELHLQHGIATAVGSSMGYTPPEVGSAFSRAFELSWKVGDFPDRHSILFGLWLYYLMRAEYDRSAPLAREFLAMAEQSGEPERRLVAHSLYGVDRFFVGKLHETADHNEKAWTLYLDLEEPPVHRQYGMNSGALAADFLAYNAQLMGFSDASCRYHDHAISAAERTGDPVTLGTVLAHATMTASLRLDIDRTELLARRTIAFCQQSGVFIREVEAEIMLGWVQGERGDSPTGLATLTGALAKWNMIGAHITDTFFLSLIATALWKAGRADEARERARKAVDVAERAGERLFLPEAIRIEADLLFAMDENVDAALGRYENAILTARDMDARWWELRSTVRKVRLLRRMGHVQEAYGALSSIYAWFTEGLDLPEMREAKALLEELEAARPKIFIPAG